MGHRNGGRINAANVNQHVVTARPSAPKKKPAKAAAKVAPEPEKVEPPKDETTEEAPTWPTVTPTPTSKPSKGD